MKEFAVPTLGSFDTCAVPGDNEVVAGRGVLFFRLGLLLQTVHGSFLTDDGTADEWRAHPGVQTAITVAGSILPLLGTEAT